MQIVIDIDDERYKDIQRIASAQLDMARFQTAEQIIANGTPLPKGHGRLIDADWLKFALHNFFYGLKRPVEEEDIQRYIDVTRSIIEADKAEGSDKE